MDSQSSLPWITSKNFKTLKDEHFVATYSFLIKFVSKVKINMEVLISAKQLTLLNNAMFNKNSTAYDSYFSDVCLEVKNLYSFHSLSLSVISNFPAFFFFFFLSINL